MMKYIFCILLGVFVMVAIHCTPDKALEEFWPESPTATVNVPSDVEVHSHTLSTLMPDQSDWIKSTVHHNLSRFKRSDSILRNVSFPRTIIPQKVIKGHSLSKIARLIRSYEVKLPENKWQSSYPHTYYIKYFCGYYVYSIGHILI